MFYEKISAVGGSASGGKVPPPTWCPECRMIRRSLFRNVKNLFRRKDSLTGKEIFSGIPPEAPVKVYDHDYWWSDLWDPVDYGRDYDFSRSFFEQFRELLYTVPWPSRDVLNLINSPYSNNIGWSKNCYLCFNGGNLEDCVYVVDADSAKNSIDLTSVDGAELSYECFNLDNCFRTFFSIHCLECQNVWFSRDLTGCSNCFGCVNLRNKHYYIFNKAYSKEEYFKELQKFNLGSYESIRDFKIKAENFWSDYPTKYFHGWRNADVSGDLLSHSKNAKFSYNATGLEDSKYCQSVWDQVRDVYDATDVGWAETSYEFCQGGVDGANNLKFSFECWPAVHNIEYSAFCKSSSELFGCVGLKKKSYCILNKQYSKEEYQALRERIIKHMSEMPYFDSEKRRYIYGEFFSPEFSPFAYNDTIAQDFLPLDKDGANKLGYKWRDPASGEHQISTTAKDLPDRIQDVADSILTEVIQCLLCGGPYRLIPTELEFYRKIGLPIPRLCPDCRYLKRTKYRNPVHYYDRTCQCGGLKSENSRYLNDAQHSHGSLLCSNQFITTYPPDSTIIIYCEQCYNAEAV